MGGILEDLQMGAGVGEKIRDDRRDELAWLGPETGRQEVRERDDCSLGGEFRRKPDVNMRPDLHPSLENPSLRGRGLAFPEQGGNLPIFPKDSALLVG